MNPIEESERNALLTEVVQNASSMLYMAFVLCDLKTHIRLTCTFGGKPFKLTFEPIEPDKL